MQSRAGLVCFVLSILYALSALVAISSALPVSPPCSATGTDLGNAYGPRSQGVYAAGVPAKCATGRVHATVVEQDVTVITETSGEEELERRSLFGHITHAIGSAVHSVTHVVKTAAHLATHPIEAVKHVVNNVKQVVHAVTHPISTIKHVAQRITHTVSHVAHAITHTVSHVVHSVKNTIHHVAHTIKHTVHHLAHSVKHFVKNAGKSIKEAAHWVKQNGPAIAKIGLKMLASSQGILSTVAKVVPGAGIPLSKALKFEAKGLDAASNMIPAHVSKGWQTAMDVMDVAEDPIGNGLKKVGLHGAVGAAASMILG